MNTLNTPKDIGNVSNMAVAAPITNAKIDTDGNQNITVSTAITKKANILPSKHTTINGAIRREGLLDHTDSGRELTHFADSIRGAPQNNIDHQAIVMANRPDPTGFREADDQLLKI